MDRSCHALGDVAGAAAAGVGGRTAGEQGCGLSGAGPAPEPDLPG